MGKLAALAGQTVVITGASSGIGRATALMFARSGANLVLASRRKEVLVDLAHQCVALGARATAAPTDVSDPSAMQALAQAAERRYGRIDVWINNAGVGAVGRLEEVDLALHRQTIEVNLMGALHGAAAVVPRFIRQGHGLLINNVSLGAWTPTPFAAAYAASKFGLRGLTASLRQELAPYPDIHVCAVFPAIVDTPGFAHGANWSGRSLNPGPLLYRPDDVARVFLRLIGRPRAETVVGWPSAASKFAYGLAPVLTERLVGLALRTVLARAKPGPTTDGALLAAGPGPGDTDGAWLDRKGLPPASVFNRALAATLLAGAAIALASLWRRSASRR
ncbi:short-chain dehydrogenase [Caulobacter flavus]|uniref:Short-chain dehydrogenase n=1 Tax=Caulobacter flavus TaxID=1679497 RepID=A0A2N5CX37_9CAUL|nr:SDR family oxidoreductase [Caulobacter flavus]AYV47523.1 short-chain dehydrogenase [Caulobacter flavus]PLR18365.1 short-chain dehydrogenase [Caulobacter flavus]